MKIRIENVAKFEEMLANGLIKKEWSLIEQYGVSYVVGVAFEDYLDYEGIGSAGMCNKGVLEAYLYKGVVFKGIHVDRAYIHQNGDIVLINDDGEKIIIIENVVTRTRDFHSGSYVCKECGICGSK